MNALFVLGFLAILPKSKRAVLMIVVWVIQCFLKTIYSENFALPEVWSVKGKVFINRNKKLRIWSRSDGAFCLDCDVLDTNRPLTLYFSNLLVWEGFSFLMDSTAGHIIKIHQHEKLQKTMSVSWGAPGTFRNICNIHSLHCSGKEVCSWHIPAESYMIIYSLHLILLWWFRSPPPPLPPMVSITQNRPSAWQ